MNNNEKETKENHMHTGNGVRIDLSEGVLQNGIPNSKRNKKQNEIVTSRFTLFTFLPKAVLEQFRKRNNIFFLCMVILQLTFPVPTNASLYILAFALIIAVSVIKIGAEDRVKRRADDLVNNRHILLYNHVQRTFNETKSQDLKVGQIIELKENEDVPADCIFLGGISVDGLLSLRCEINTANLDGEPNTKIRKSPVGSIFQYTPVKKMFNIANGIDTILTYEPEFFYELPNADLHEFNGTLSYMDDIVQNYVKLHLTMDNILLRGATVKGPSSVFALIIYTGAETRLSINTNKNLRGKFSVVDKSSNTLGLGISILLISLVSISTGYFLFFNASSLYQGAWYIPLYDGGEFWLTIVTACIIIVIFSPAIPISLSVTIELQRWGSKMYFGWDEDIKKGSEYGTCNNSGVVDELGQIDFLLADKTGTLTDNKLEFKCCSIAGKEFQFSNGTLIGWNQDLTYKNQSDIDFWEAVALCHSIQAVNLPENPKIVYRGESGDEEVLVAAAQSVGIEFIGEEDGPKGNETYMKILNHTENGGQLKKYKLHLKLPFDSDRKCMSVIVEDQEGKIFLVAKGAESTIFKKSKSKTQPDILEICDNQTTSFAQKGLRVLAFGIRRLSIEEFEYIHDEFDRIETKDEFRDFFNTVEQNLVLIGLTGVEDKLQHLVPETISSLREAGIRIGMLTGDKLETAISIATTAGLIDSQASINRLISVTEKDQLILKLRKFTEGTVLVIDSNTFGLGFDCCQEDLATAIQLASVIVFCRMTPLQKAQVVKLLKKYNNSSNRCICAVGDGGNDVAMIQEASVGIGILGREGRQAARASDFSIPQFSALRKAILVHGYWNYTRLTFTMNYFYYRSFVTFVPQFIYVFYTGGSGQSLAESAFSMFFPLFFSGSPILVYGLTERLESEEEILRNPSIYTRNKGNMGISLQTTIYWLCMSIFHTLLITFFLELIWPGGLGNLTWAEGSHVMNAALLIVTAFKLMINTTTFTWLTFLAQVQTLGFFIIFFTLYSEVIFTAGSTGLLSFAYFPVLKRLEFWLSLLLIGGVSIIPDLLMQEKRRRMFLQNTKYRKTNAIKNEMKV